MAINKNKKQEVQAEESKALDIEVKRAKDFTREGVDGCTIAFDMVVNGVTIYGCWYREGKNKKKEDYTMVSFPSRKSDDGQFYNWAYVKLSDTDIENISKQIENLL